MFVWGSCCQSMFCIFLPRSAGIDALHLRLVACEGMLVQAPRCLLGLNLTRQWLTTSLCTESSSAQALAGTCACSYRQQPSTTANANMHTHPLHKRMHPKNGMSKHCRETEALHIHHTPMQSKHAKASMHACDMAWHAQTNVVPMHGVNTNRT